MPSFVDKVYPRNINWNKSTRKATTLGSIQENPAIGGKKKKKRKKRRKTKRRKPKRKTKRKRRKRKTRKKKKQKGGSCYYTANCFFIKGHGTSNRRKFEVPENIEINFYAPKGYLAPAFYNDIRDTCYDIDLKGEGPCDTHIAMEICPDYRITNFKGEKQTSESTYYAAPNAGLYNCPPFYKNAGTGYKGAELIEHISDNGTTLSEMVTIVKNRSSGNWTNIINCNFCRGTNAAYANQFFGRIPTNDHPETPETAGTGRFSKEYNKHMYDQYQKNMQRDNNNNKISPRRARRVSPKNQGKNSIENGDNTGKKVNKALANQKKKRQSKLAAKRSSNKNSNNNDDNNNNNDDNNNNNDNNNTNNGNP